MLVALPLDALELIRAIHGVEGQHMELFIVGQVSIAIVGLEQRHMDSATILHVVQITMRVSTEVQAGCHTREGFARLQAQPAIGGLVLVLGLIVIGARADLLEDRCQQCCYQVHVILDGSLLTLHAQAELSHCLGARVFAAIVVHGPTTAEAVRGTRGLRIQSCKGKTKGNSQ